MADTTFGPDHFWPRPLLDLPNGPKKVTTFGPLQVLPLLAQTTFGPDHFLAVSGAPKGGAPKGGAPKGVGGPTIFSFFFIPLPATFFFSFFLSWRSFRVILVVFEAPGP